MNKLDFFLFYTTLFGFIVLFGTMAGVTILTNTGQISAISQQNFNPLNPFDYMSFFFNLMSVGSSNNIYLYVIVLIPFSIGLSWIILSYIRGV